MGRTKLAAGLFSLTLMCQSALPLDAASETLLITDYSGRGFAPDLVHYEVEAPAAEAARFMLRSARRSSRHWAQLGLSIMSMRNCS